MVKWIRKKRGDSLYVLCQRDLENTLKYEYPKCVIGFFPAIFSRLLDRLAWHEMRKHLSFVVGAELHQKYLSNGIKTVSIITSLVAHDDVMEFIPKRTLEDEVSLLTIGRLSPERGIETLLEVLSVLNTTCQVRLICKIIGGGPHRQYLEHNARNLLLNNVVFTSYVPCGPEMIRQYREADVFVLPSHTDGFPKVILEAMANAVPIVSTSVGGIPYVLKSGHDSILVPSRNPEALAGAIVELVQDIDLYNSIGLNAFHTVQELTYEKQSEIFAKNVYDYVTSIERSST